MTHYAKMFDRRQSILSYQMLLPVGSLPRYAENVKVWILKIDQH